MTAYQIRHDTKHRNPLASSGLLPGVRAAPHPGALTFHRPVTNRSLSAGGRGQDQARPSPPSRKPQGKDVHPGPAGPGLRSVCNGLRAQLGGCVLSLTEDETTALLRDMRRSGRANLLSYLAAQQRGYAPRYGDHPAIARHNQMKHDHYEAAQAFIESQHIQFPTTRT